MLDSEAPQQQGMDREKFSGPNLLPPTPAIVDHIMAAAMPFVLHRTKCKTTTACHRLRFRRPLTKARSALEVDGLTIFVPVPKKTAT